MKTRSRECKCVENVNRELLKQQNELVLSHTISMGAPSRVMRTMCIIETQESALVENEAIRVRPKSRYGGSRRV